MGTVTPPKTKFVIPLKLFDADRCYLVHTNFDFEGRNIAHLFSGFYFSLYSLGTKRYDELCNISSIITHRKIFKKNRRIASDENSPLFLFFGKGGQEWNLWEAAANVNYATA